MSLRQPLLIATCALLHADRDIDLVNLMLQRQRSELAGRSVGHSDSLVTFDGVFRHWSHQLALELLLVLKILRLTLTVSVLQGSPLLLGCDVNSCGSAEI
jgi:hypothetical protein